ncbi:hypothetical protein X566_17970 [Afipia sp. P52-10]|uniref:hypothetical protein n=1 Tax=Afipia sp. P52-10 TaxID=1429916 RepID=UPI0003DF0E0E|nr:hypothetical protein [Afipia sp. P52-10]ETR74713.1 hypothetical protein X566_17970 [Afipia sp. P52-10]
MAVTANVYNHYMALIAAQTINNANLKLMLLKSTASFNAAHTTVDAVAGAGPTRAHEFYGNGWPQGGKAVTNVAATTITTNDAKLSGDQTSQTASGGNIGPCRYVLLYDATSMKPLVLYDLGQDEYAGDTTDFKLTFDLLGSAGTIYTLTV